MRFGMFSLRSIGLQVLISVSAVLVAVEGYDTGMAALGIPGLRPVPISVQAQVGLDPGEGALIRYVWPGSAAEDMGLQVGDVVTEINGQPVNRASDLYQTVISSQAGDDVSVTVRRGDPEPLTIDGSFMDMPDRIEGYINEGLASGRLQEHRAERNARWDAVADYQREVIAAQNEQAKILRYRMQQLDGVAMDGNDADSVQRLINSGGSEFPGLIIGAEDANGSLAWSFQHQFTFSLQDQSEIF